MIIPEGLAFSRSHGNWINYMKVSGIRPGEGARRCATRRQGVFADAAIVLSKPTRHFPGGPQCRMEPRPNFIVALTLLLNACR